MSLPQRKFREIVFQLLYSHDLAQPAADDVIPLVMEELSVSKANLRQAVARMERVLKHHLELDQMIEGALDDYTLDRVHRVERNILRLALFEMLFDEQIPPKVALSEGVRLARKFSTPDAAKFVNAVLDRLFREKSHPDEDLDAKDFFSQGAKDGHS